MIKYQKLPEEYAARVKECYLDTLIEKHEGGSWKSRVEYEQVFMIEVLDCHLVMDCYKEKFDNMTILNAYKSPDEKEIVVRLKDYTFCDDFDAGYIALGTLLEGTNIYVTSFYHNFYDWTRLKK
jgi:hypothetical protein